MKFNHCDEVSSFVGGWIQVNGTYKKETYFCAAYRFLKSQIIKPPDLMESFKIIEPQTINEIEAYYNIRYEILRKPWNQSKKTINDEGENKSIHILMLDEKDKAIACGRLQLHSHEEGQIHSMAVAENRRRKGLGSKIINHLEHRANELKLKRIVIDARENAVGFYEHSGYKVTGNSYLSFGVISHYRMEKILRS